jgi:hypothetical protein
MVGRHFAGHSILLLEDGARPGGDRRGTTLASLAAGLAESPVLPVRLPANGRRQTDAVTSDMPKS